MMDPAPLRTTRPPEPGQVRPFTFPEVEYERLESGLELRTARMPRLPVVTATLVFGAGEATLPEERGGLAVLAGSALHGGTRRRSGADLARSLEALGASIEVSTGWDACAISLTCLADRLDAALGLLSELVQEPSFPESEVARFRDQRLAAIEQRRMDAGKLADDEAARVIFAPGVPYGRPVAGTRESVAGLDREDLTRFAGERFGPRGAGFVVVGDVHPGEVRSLAETHLGEWTGGGGPVGDVPVAARFGHRWVRVVHRPGSVQSDIRLGHMGAARSSVDFFSLLVLNTVLGGAFTSRLNLNLRETLGVTYGVRSRFVFRRSPGPFLISTAVDTDATADAVRETLREVEGVVEAGPTEEELSAARDYIAGVFPLRLETTGQVASAVAESFVYRLPEDYHRTYRDRIRAVGRESAVAAARRHLRPHELVAVVVGDAERIRGPLEEVGLGPVEVCEQP
jgi:zinc protease